MKWALLLVPLTSPWAFFSTAQGRGGCLTTRRAVYWVIAASCSRSFLVSLNVSLVDCTQQHGGLEDTLLTSVSNILIGCNRTQTRWKLAFLIERGHTVFVVNSM